MRLEKLVLRRFGHFTDFSLDFGSHDKGTPDLHVLYGPNEAGKSTTLAAISDLLYGIKRQTLWSFLHANDVLELEAVLQQGAQSLGIRRFKNHWSNLNNDRLERFPLDLQGLSREDYVRRFSFDEQTLQDGGEQILNSDGDVGQALFSASAGLADLKERMDAAIVEANAFWMPNRRTNLLLPALKKALQENKQQTDAIALDVKTWKKRQDILSATELRRNECRQERDELQELISQLETQKAATALAVQHATLKASLQTLETEGVVPIDSHSLAMDFSASNTTRESLERVRKLLEQNRLATASHTDMSAELQTLQAQATALSPETKAVALTQASKQIKQLSEETSADYEWRKQLTEFQGVVGQCDQELAAALERLNLPSDTPLEATLPGEKLLTELSRLLDEEQVLTSQLSHAEKELSQLEEVTGADEETADDARFIELETTLSIASDVLRRIQQAGLSKQLALARESLTECRRTLRVQSKQAGISSEQLQELTIPDAAWLNTSLTELTECHRQGIQLQSKVDDLRQDIQEKESACEQLALSGATDPNVLITSKQARDAAWHTHSSALDDELSPLQLQKSARQFEHQLHQYDELISNAQSASQASAELQLLQAQLSQQQQSLSALLKGAVDKQQQQLHACEKKITQHVIEFYSTTEIDIETLKQRYSQVTLLKEAYIDCESHQVTLEELEQQCDTQCRELMAVLDSLQSTAPAKTLQSINLVDLLTHADNTLEAAKNKLAHERESKRENQARVDAFKQRSQNKLIANQALTQWQKQWESSSKNSLFSTMSLLQARDTLPWIASVRPVLTKRKDALSNLDSLTQKIATRDESIAELLKRLQGESLAALVQQLESVSQQANEHARLLKQIHALDNKLSKSKTDHQHITSTLDTLRSDLAVDSDDNLLALLSRTEQHRNLYERSQASLTQLAEIYGADVDNIKLEQLCQSSDTDELNRRLKDLKGRLSEANSSYDKSNQAWALANSAVTEVQDDGQYTRLVLQRKNLLLEIADHARQNAIARCGQRVFIAAMAKFRQEHQSVILSEAQQAFRTLTGGRYVQLLPRDDGKGNEKLYVIDEQKKARAVNELSTGTRYQLYLALRAAAHADYATQRTPLPFVADDIMESFDDERSAAAFKVLGEMAERGQVLYLTHHQHLLDIAQETIGRERIKIHHYP